ncbi:MAG: hypothetical protein C4332_15995 [Meiothermus sp.]
MRSFDLLRDLFLWLMAALALAWIVTLGQTLLEVWGGIKLSLHLGSLVGLAVLVLGAAWVWARSRR